RDVVAITHCGDRLDGPPEALAERGEVLVVDRRHEQPEGDGRDGRDRGDDRGTAAGRLGARKGTVEPAFQPSLVFHRLRVPFTGRVSSSGCRPTPRRSKSHVHPSVLSLDRDASTFGDFREL